MAGILRFAAGLAAGAAATVAFQFFTKLDNDDLPTSSSTTQVKSVAESKNSSKTTTASSSSAASSSKTSKTAISSNALPVAATSSTSSTTASSKTARTLSKCECAMCLKRYIVGKKLGEGAFGITYLAQDRQTNTQVCLKFTKMPDLGELNQALSECVFLTEVKHRHVTHMSDFFAHIEARKEGKLIIVMDYCDGGDLHDLIQKYEDAKTNLPERTMLTFINQLVHAVHFIHSKNIIHRDLKPENVLLSSRISRNAANATTLSTSSTSASSSSISPTALEDTFDIKIADFGLSKFIDLAEHEAAKQKQIARANRRKTKNLRSSNSSSSVAASSIDFDPRLAMSLAGTFDYMAPEMRNSKKIFANKKVDVWSLGCIFLELATSKIIMDDETKDKQWLTKRMPLIPNYACRKPLVAMITACLQMDPDKRVSLNNLMKTPLIAVHNNVLRSNAQAVPRHGLKGLKRHHKRVPQSVPIHNRAHTRLLSPTGVFDRPDVPLNQNQKRQKVTHRDHFR